jgi:CO/xanthine dehydrogenase FAD-binding subunit
MKNTKSIQKMETKKGSTALRFDAAVVLDEIYSCEDVPEIVLDSLEGVVTWQQRNETSLARFLAAPRQFPAFALALLACGAVAQVGDGEMDLNSYFSVRQDEKAAALLLPVEVPGLRLAAARVGLTPTGEDIVLAAVGVVLKDGMVSDARLALSGVWQGRQWLSAAVEGLSGAALSGESIQSAAEAVEKEVDPPTDYLGSAGYRRAMAVVLTRQVLEACKHGVGND